MIVLILSTSNNGADICKNNPSLSLSSDSSTVAFSMYSSSAQQLVVLIYRFINGIWNRLGSQDFNVLNVNYHTMEANLL